MAWSDVILTFLGNLDLPINCLPKHIYPLLPLKGDNAGIIHRTTTGFYNKFYNDDAPRRMIIGINPGRLGAGVTGLPFTDTKRLKQYCGMELKEFSTHEPSSVFIYDVIEAFGGAEAFYKQFYITSVCSVGFVIEKDNGKRINYNYYDSKELTVAVEPFIIKKMWEQIEFGVDTSVAYCLGTGKNYKYLKSLNDREHFFDNIIPLEHPRYVMQYKNKNKAMYIDKFLTAFNKV